MNPTSAPASEIAPSRGEKVPAEVVARYQARLLGRIRLMMGPTARECLESGDVLQDVFAEALRDVCAHELGDERVFLRWLTAVARNHIVDVVRRNREHSFETLSSGLIAMGAPSVVAQLSLEEAKQRLVEALEELDPIRQRVVELRSLEGWSWQRIARELGRSEEAGRKLYHRTLLELGQRLGNPSVKA
jgi:RNA polymerase sigma factor (sigma-70 family)